MKQIIQIWKNDNLKGNGRNTKRGTKFKTKITTPKNKREEKKNAQIQTLSLGLNLC
jgi:hypothetical protein